MCTSIAGGKDNIVGIFDDLEKFLSLPSSSTTPYVGGGTREEAFWRVLIADKGEDDQRATDDDIQKMHGWRGLT